MATLKFLTVKFIYNYPVNPVKNMKTCAFITLGCKVNQYETQALRESLTSKGFVEIVPEQAADLYVINTCTVTSASDEKSRQYIKWVRRKNPSAKIGRAHV